jgi:hypothetical protein
MFLRPQDKRSYITRFLVNDIKGPFIGLLSIYRLTPLSDASTADVREGRVPQVSYICPPETLALCKGFQPQLFLTYHNTGTHISLLLSHLTPLSQIESPCWMPTICFAMLQR